MGRTLGNIYGPGTGRIWLDNLRCTGRESFIGDCDHNGWGQHNCAHYEDVSIICYRGPSANGHWTFRRNLGYYFYAFANLVVVGVMFPEFSCVGEFQTNIASKISCVFVDGIWPNFYH